MISDTSVVGIGTAAKALGMSVSKLRRLADADRVPSTRTVGGHRRFDVAAVRTALAPPRVMSLPTARQPDWQATFPIAGLEEHLVWSEIADRFSLDPRSSNASHIANHAFTEMLNNAIDHSGGVTVDVRVWADEDEIAFEIADDGVGAFERMRSEHRLASLLDAMVELSKGKRTTAPEHHAGEGIFFTSKAVDVFALEANGLIWIVDNQLADQAAGESASEVGTRVSCRIDRATVRDLVDIFNVFAPDGVFSRTRPSVRLLQHGTRFVSRSEAKRLLVGLDQFAEIEFDFAGVEAVGQAFVDEVFRVWSSAHPGIRVIPRNMNSAVAFMVHRGFRD